MSSSGLADDDDLKQNRMTDKRKNITELFQILASNIKYKYNATL